MLKKIFLLVVVVALSAVACSSTNSIKSNEGESVSGLAYFMPKKDFKVTITVGKEENITNVVFGTTEAYADTSEQYSLVYRRNYILKNALKIGINTKGLLETTKAEVTNTIPAAIKEITETLINRDSVETSTKCEAEGDHVFIIPADEIYSPSSFCNLTITVAKIPKKTITLNGKSNSKNDKADDESGNMKGYDSGVFYRTLEPYKMTSSGTFNKASIVFSPSLSPSHFLPIARSLFSDTKIDFAFTNGVPTKYEQETEGEFISFLTIPAQILNAYALSAGSIFSNFSKIDKDKVNVESSKLKLELLKSQQKACLAAIEKEDDTLAKTLCVFP